MIYLALIISAIGFFMMGFYFCRFKTLNRLRKFIGKDILPILTVLKIITNKLENKVK